MSLAVTIVTTEGAVMAADTHETIHGRPNRRRKLHATPSGVGVSVVYDLHVQAAPVLDLEAFLVGLTGEAPHAVAEAVHERLTAGVQEERDRANAHVVGYQDGQADVWGVDTRHGLSRLLPPGHVGSAWLGEPHAMMRLFQPVYKRTAGDEYEAVPHNETPYEQFTLEEAVDFAVFGIRTTEQLLKFQRRETVGGDVDILIITPSGARSHTQSVEVRA